MGQACPQLTHLPVLMLKKHCFLPSEQVGIILMHSLPFCVNKVIFHEIFCFKNMQANPRWFRLRHVYIILVLKLTQWTERSPLRSLCTVPQVVKEMAALCVTLRLAALTVHYLTLF